MFNWIFSKPKVNNTYVPVDGSIEEYDAFASKMNKIRAAMEQNGEVFYGRPRVN